MSHALTPLHLLHNAVPHIEIDWPTLIEQRALVLTHSDVPAYLLLPEVRHIIQSARHDHLVLMLETLWHTGARISELLALTPGHFTLDAKQPYVSIQTLKTRGRPRKGQQGVKPRMVPISDEHFLLQLDRYLTSNPLRKNERLWPVTRSAVNKRLDRLIGSMHQVPRIRVSPHTFRHSFAVNAILHGTPLPVLQGWLGHADINSTLVYTQVLTLETYHLMQRIQF